MRIGEAFAQTPRAGPSGVRYGPALGSGCGSWVEDWLSIFLQTRNEQDPARDATVKRLRAPGRRARRLRDKPAREESAFHKGVEAVP